MSVEGVRVVGDEALGRVARDEQQLHVRVGGCDAARDAGAAERTAPSVSRGGATSSELIL